MFTNLGSGAFELIPVHAELSEDKTKVVFFDESVGMEEPIVYSVDMFVNDFDQDCRKFLIDYYDGEIAGGLDMHSPLELALPYMASLVTDSDPEGLPDWWSLSGDESTGGVISERYPYDLDSYLEEIEQEVCLLKSRRGTPDDMDFLLPLIPEELYKDFFRVEVTT
jgi:hypothetical protein